MRAFTSAVLPTIVKEDMSVFRDPEAFARTTERLQSVSGSFDTPDWASLFAEAPDPDRAYVNFERWITSTGSPGTYLSMVLSAPRLAAWLVAILGGSQPLADSLIQNPELGAIVFDPGERGKVPTLEGLIQEGRMLLKTSTSPSHELDRLRFMKQRWTLGIALNDLAESWAQVEVWRAISVLAQALTQLAMESVWTEETECPLMVIGFGKLGGEELNYSSDVDLAYVAIDGIDEATDRKLTRTCEAHTRAIADRMGRGQLYRVDLRLRPYGGAGAILRTMRAYEAYYELYAEPWEIQALMRSRPLCGPPELIARWEAMRTKMCFRGKWAENTVQALLDMRQRIEELSKEGDLKRGRGGIRDVEFLVQILQLLHAQDRPELQMRPTLPAIRALEDAFLLDTATAQSLREGYTFLRKLEHRLQMADDQQTHALPSSPESQTALAKRMGEHDWVQLMAKLDTVKQGVGSVYTDRFHTVAEPESVRGRVLAAFDVDASVLAAWFDVLDGSESFYAALLESPEALSRVRRLVRFAPWLVRYYRASLSLTEQIVSGEIEEPRDSSQRFRMLDRDLPVEKVALVLQFGFAETCTRWVLDPGFDLGVLLANLYSEAIAAFARRLEINFDILAMGSFASNDLGPQSDLDLVFLVADQKHHREGERKSQEFLQFVLSLHRLGAPIEIDLRLRPDGGKGLLLRSYDALLQYDLDGMEMWERFALGHARLVAGREESVKVVLKVTYGQPLTPERLQELVKMKRRIETERVQSTQTHRQVKLGRGGLNDIEWTVRLTEMRYPSATRAGTTSDSQERMTNIGRSGLLNAVEVEQLLSARAFYSHLRIWLSLLGIRDDLIPENPDKLQRLAEAMGIATGNELLAQYQQMTTTIRSLFEDTLERLKA